MPKLGPWRRPVTMTDAASANLTKLCYNSCGNAWSHEITPQTAFCEINDRRSRPRRIDCPAALAAFTALGEAEARLCLPGRRDGCAGGCRWRLLLRDAAGDTEGRGGPRQQRRPQGRAGAGAGLQ